MKNRLRAVFSSFLYNIHFFRIDKARRLVYNIMGKKCLKLK